MLYVVLRWLINAIFLMIIPYFVGGFQVESFFIALIAALILAFLNAVIRPFLILITLPINILTLGIFTLFINGLIFWLVSTFIRGFSVTGFWPAFWAALIFSIFSMILNYFVEGKNNQPYVEKIID